MGTTTKPTPAPRPRGPRMKRRGPKRWGPSYDRPRRAETIDGYQVYFKDVTPKEGLPRFSYEIQVPWSDVSYAHVYQTWPSFVQARTAARQEIYKLRKEAGKRAGMQTYKAEWDEEFDIRRDYEGWYVVSHRTGHLGPATTDPYDGFPTHAEPRRPAITRYSWGERGKQYFDTSEEAYDAMVEAIDETYAEHLAEREEERKAEKKLAKERKEMETYMGRARNPAPVSSADLIRRLKF